MLGLEQKPSPHEFLQIAGEEHRNFICLYLFRVDSCAESCRGLTDDALVAPGQGLPAGTAVRVEAGAAHVGPDGEQTQQENGFESPKLLLVQTTKHGPLLWALRVNECDAQPPPGMDRWRAGECERADSGRGLEPKHERTGAINSDQDSWSLPVLWKSSAFAALTLPRQNSRA